MKDERETGCCVRQGLVVGAHVSDRGMVGTHRSDGVGRQKTLRDGDVDASLLDHSSVRDDAGRASAERVGTLPRVMQEDGGLGGGDGNGDGGLVGRGEGRRDGGEVGLGGVGDSGRRPFEFLDAGRDLVLESSNVGDHRVILGGLLREAALQ